MPRHWLLLIATVLWGTSTAQLNLLAVLLHDAGRSEADISVILTAPPLALLSSALIVAPIINRFGAAQTFTIGTIVSSIGVIALLLFAADSLALVTAANFARGFGLGMVIPAGVLYARSCASEIDRVYYVGVFGTALIAPNLFGAALGEQMLPYGATAFLMAAIAPLLMALVVSHYLPRDRSRSPSPQGYLVLLRDARTWLPNLAAMQSGLGFGLATSFLPLLLVEHRVPAAWFFAPFAIGLLLMRLAVMRYAQRAGPMALLIVGLAAYTTALALLSAVVSRPYTAVAGCLVALGYSLIYPVAVELSSRTGDAVCSAGLVNASFNVGSIAAVQCIGIMLASIGWTGSLTALTLVVAAVLLITVGATVRDSCRIHAYGASGQSP